MTHRRLLLFVLIFVGLCSVYMIFYSANYHEFGDSPYLYNITASLVRYNDTLFDLMAYNWPTRVDNTFYQDQLYPLYYYREDLTSVVLATPLYWLAFNVQGLGLLHTVWLFNIFVCAASCGLMFLYAVLLGYGERTGVIAALTLGLATIVMPYSKVFLQEPITLFVTLALAFTLECWRKSRYRWVWLIPIALLLLAFFNVKLSSYAALPGLVLIAIPTLRISEKFWRRLSLVLFTLIALFTLYVAFNDIRPLLSWMTAPIANFYLPSLDGYVYQFIQQPYIMIAVRTYLFSIGASIWATSPATLLAFAGGWLLFRKGQMRYVWVCLLVVVGYIFSYAILRGVAWYGSVTYPSRFLVPAVPFLILLTLPALERLTQRPVPRILGVVFAGLFVYGAWIAFNGVSYQWDVHDKLLPAGMLLSQGEAAYDLRYAPWVLLPTLWGQRPFDFAWVRTGQWGVPLLFGAIALVCGVWLWRVLAANVSPLKTTLRPIGAAASLCLVLVVAIFITLRAIYIDPLYWGENPDLHVMLNVIEQETQPPDMVFVTSREQIGFLFNYGDVRNARLVGLPFQRGEQYSPEQLPLVVSNNLDDLVDVSTPPLLYAAALQRERLWLLTEFGPYHPWARRVVERWMTREFYPIRSIEIANAVRLIEFATATPLETQTTLDRITDLRFGDHITLEQVTLPLGTTYQAGDALPVAFYWQTDAPLDTDYTVAWFIADSGGVRVQGVDSAPQMGFVPTTTWLRSLPVPDHRALRLPADLPAGEYQVWVVLYPTGSDGSQRLSVTGAETHDSEIGVLPVRINVR